MATYQDFKAAIFDVDDTLLDNFPHDPARRMHERSRRAAIHEVGQRHHIQPLIELTLEQNAEGFLTAPMHSLESATWNIMFMLGLVPVNEPDPSNPIFQEIIRRKNELHEKILREEGVEVPGASAFVRSLAAHGLADKMAIASTAVRRDIDLFLEKVGLLEFFPEERLISKDKVTHPKPNPEAFELAFQSLQLPEAARQHVLVFEDDPRGIMAAKGANLTVYAITTCFSRQHLASLPVPPDVIAGSFAEFAQLLQLPLLDPGA